MAQLLLIPQTAKWFRAMALPRCSRGGRYPPRFSFSRSLTNSPFSATEPAALVLHPIRCRRIENVWNQTLSPSRRPAPSQGCNTLQTGEQCGADSKAAPLAGCDRSLLLGFIPDHTAQPAASVLDAAAFRKSESVESVCKLHPRHRQPEQV